MAQLKLKGIDGAYYLVDTNRVLNLSLSGNQVVVTTADETIYLDPTEYDKLYDAINAPR